ncbi:MAG TPA: 4-hydroxythreonine-4-phosphate dehydrogenase PdxA, partial [Mycobacteriales bacterium]|nr:4-hydroxythreonine-4-phosphate dehydrogenase PdxA [Mycobacteriales bacterium]
MVPRRAASAARLLVIADDLSGATETAAVLCGPGRPAEILLSGGASVARVVVRDLDIRLRSPADAAAAVGRAVAGAPGRILMKVDSLLRGNLAAQVEALRAGGAPVVVATALPAMGRTVRGGVVHLDGVPLHRTTAWAIERRPPPISIAAALAPVPVAVVEDPAGLPEVLASGRIPVCDASTDEDLDRIVAVTRDLPGVRLVGTGGLAAALGRAMGATALPPDAAVTGALLVVVGSAAPEAEEQVRRLGIPHFVAGIADPDRIAAALKDGPAVLSLGFTPPDPARSEHLITTLTGAAAATLATTAADLVLTGGQTARRILDRLGIDRLTPVASVHHGAVTCRTPDGRLVVTRPGSYGGPDSLIRITEALRPFRRKASTVDTPYIAVTMGDGAGVGPEVTVGGLLDPAVAEICRPVVIGDAARLRAAAAVMNRTADIVAVDGIADARFEPGRINVIDLGLLPADLEWGVLSPAAGDAAYHYVRVASELAMSGQVQAICTAPLNKEALHAGGHLFPGHTEMLAQLTGTEEVSMMLTSPKLRVIHVTTHIGLIDAIARIEPGLVERTVRRGYEAMHRAGISAPRIGICGINPHAGEGGLFGHGEEEEKIVPAVQTLRADGIDARGPLPADTLFFVAARGDYDLVVAMYHDQGHGPIKVLGIEAGVNVTVGLPVIRTSVDHGTAFDIAGTGTVRTESMVEA